MSKETEKVKPDWVKIKPAELSKIILALHKEGNSPAKIGLILRDQHGIPRAKLLGKKITAFLKEENQTIETQVPQIEKSKANLERHIAKNKHDYTALKTLHKKLWDLNRAKKQLEA
ncbi:MAG: hypothetical protein Q7R87_00430 [Nanoarchaeota archaeon]|nr:hypothetical protein [Nanoarchaeota archaeon]